MTDTTNNHRVVFSPLGEQFEVTPANFFDLTRNAGWHTSKPHPDTVREYCEKTGATLPAEFGGEAETAPVAPPETPAPAAPVETPAPAAPVETPAPPAPEQTTSSEAPENVENEDQGPAFKSVPSDFADMDRDAVKNYITDTFPGTEIDGRKGRDALVAQALELAAASRA